MQKQMIESAKRAIDWTVSQMATDELATRGIYERWRIDVGELVKWVRPDCNTEVARLISKYAEVTGDHQFDKVRDNIIEWLLSVQNTHKDAFGYGAFPFYLVEGIEPDVSPETCPNYWPNDNGKILRGLVQLYHFTGDKRLIEAAERLAGFFLRIMSPTGTFPQNSVPYSGPCFRMWPALGLTYLYEVTSESKYCDGAKFILDKALSLQRESGRFVTSYELDKCEDWRPASSEAGISMKAYAEAGRILKEDRYLEAASNAAEWTIKSQDECGAISNYSIDCDGSSLQTGADITDLVYTCGYALVGLRLAANALESKEIAESADRLAGFLVNIQCSGESPSWDGAWRGSYDFVVGKWAGRCNQNNDLDEGGMYSVYTGWCVAPIAYGLLLSK